MAMENQLNKLNNFFDRKNLSYNMNQRPIKGELDSVRIYALIIGVNAGGAILLNGYLNKPALLNAWKSWCYFDEKEISRNDGFK